MTTATELVRAVEANGGHLRVDGVELVVRPGTAGRPVADELRRHKQAIIALVLERDAAVWQRPFEQWLNMACSFRPRDFAGFNCLFSSFIQWAGERDGATCSRDVFSWMLAMHDFLVAEVHGTMLVSGLMLIEDAWAHERFQESQR
jgi:hypothetical protein